MVGIRYLFQGLKIKFPKNDDNTYAFPADPKVKQQLDEVIKELKNPLTREYVPMFPMPGKAEFEVFSPEDSPYRSGDVRDDIILPRWMGHYKDAVEIIGQTHNHQSLYRSIDNGESWTRIVGGEMFNQIYTVFSTPYPNESVMVLNRPLGGDQPREWWRSTNLSNDSGSNWEKVVEASAGHFSARYGRSVWNNVIILSTYGMFDENNPPRFIYISTDYGATFREVEVVKISEMGDASKFHLHDVEYDPWNNRIWVTSGDTPANSAVHYSDDWGDTWEKVVTEPRMQSTNIQALPDRVIFGSDDVPNGIRVWYRDKTENSKPVFPEDIKFLYSPDKFGIEDKGILAIANNSKTQPTAQIAEYPFDIVNMFERDFIRNNPKYPNRLLATPDGEQWHEIFRIDGDIADGTSSTIIGPVQNDPEKKIFFIHYHQTTGTIYFQIKMPEWIIYN